MTWAWWEELKSASAFTMARLLIIGDSHVTRVNDFLQTPGCDTRGISVTCIARGGGLRAHETRNFLIEKLHEIHQFQPTHAILHVGVCDLLPVSLLEPPAKVDDVLYRVCEAGRYLEEVATPRVCISAFLPHVLKPSRKVHDQQLAQKVKRQKNYNVWVNNVFSKVDTFEGFRLLWHDRAWASSRHAVRDYYELSGNWYGFHFKEDGTRLLLKDFLDALRDNTLVDRCIIAQDVLSC